MDDKDNYHLEVSFGIDDGELDGLTMQDAFVRGFAAGSLYGSARILCNKEHVSAKMIVHSDNADRCSRIIESTGCKVVSRRWINDDWIELVIGPTETN